MAYKKLQIRRGLKSNLPTLASGELGFCTDTKEVFVGDGTTNALVTGKEKLVVNITKTGSEYASDKTYAEIKAAYENGQVVEAYLDGIIYHLVAATDDYVRFVSAAGGIELLIQIQRTDFVFGIETKTTPLTGTLTAGSTSLALSNSAITASSVIDIYTDKYGVNPAAVSVETGKITLTFEAQTEALSVRVEVR